MALSDGQRAALDNLARKQAGKDVDWISISDARALTELGLAERTREGWSITPAGQAVLDADPRPEPDDGAASGAPVPFNS
jgi:ribosomal protein S19E (S16A)